MNSNRDDEKQGLSPDELLAILTGKCLHEVQLTLAMAMLGALVIRAGGTVTLTPEEMLALSERAISIDGGPDGFRLEVIARPTEQKQPTHQAPSTRQ